VSHIGIPDKGWRIAGSGTIVSLSITQKHPQDVVVFLTTLGAEFDPHGKVKTSLDNLFHPAKIQPVQPSSEKGSG
jgi:hypothetical protein